MAEFLNLPPEIISYILHDLQPLDLIACQLTNKFLNHTIRDSKILQYHLALTRACAEDNPLCHKITADKLASLNAIEDAWKYMSADFVMTEPVPLRQSGVYDLTGGVYVLSNADRTGLGIMRLPDSVNDEVAWTMYQVGKTIIDIGLCVYEHDLMAIVTSTPRTGAPMTATTYDIQIDITELSSRKPHPRAQQNPLFVMNSSWEKPAVGIEIVGKHLVLVLSFNGHGHPKDRIYIFDWQTGSSMASFEAKSHTYAGLLFLDEDHFLLPNTRNNSLDIYQIPKVLTLEPLIPILILALPPLIEGRILGFATCRAEPNPIGKDSYAEMRSRKRPTSTDDDDTTTMTKNDILDLDPRRGFLLASSTALCMFELRVHMLELNYVHGGGIQMAFPFRFSFSFAVQRQAFLNLIDKYGWKETDDKQSAAWYPYTIPDPVPVKTNGRPAHNTHTPYYAPHPDTAEYLENQNYPPNMPFHAQRQLGIPKAKIAHPTRPTLPYTVWGEEYSAWWGGNDADISSHWVTTSAGRRCVRMPYEDRVERPMGERFYVYEFSDEVVRGRKAKKSDIDGNGRKRTEKGKGKARDDDAPSAETKPGEEDDDLPKKKSKKRMTARDLAEADRQADMAMRRETHLELIRSRDRRRGSLAAELLGADPDHGEGVAGPSSGAGASSSGSASASGSGSASASGSGSYIQRAAAAIAGSTQILDEMERIYGAAGGVIDDEAAAMGGSLRILEEMERELGAFAAEEGEDQDEWEDGGDMHDHLHEEVEMDEMEAEANDAEGDEEEDGVGGISFLPFIEGDMSDMDDEENDGYEQDYAIDLDVPHVSDASAHEGGPADDDGAESEDEQDESWAVDPLPGPEEDTLVVDYDRVLDCPEVFIHPIHHRLPYIIRASRTRHRWNGVLLDEERVIGIYSNERGHVDNIDIHHFARPDYKV